MPDKFRRVKEICDLISLTFEMPIFFISTQGEILYENVNGRSLNPFYNNEKSALYSLLKFEPDKQTDFPIIQSTYFFENYILISIVQNNQWIGTALIGPALPNAFFEQKITGMINDFQIFINREQVFNYFNSLPVIKHERLLNISCACYYLLNQIMLSPSFVQSQNIIHSQNQENITPSDKTVGQLAINRPVHHDPLLEKKFLELIREGYVEELRIFNKIEDAEVGVLSKSSYVRSKKNAVIALITLGTRAAIEGGLNSELALSLSDLFIQRLEELTTIKEIDGLQAEALVTLTEKVIEVKEERYSKAVMTCKNYIYNNRFERITQKEVADAVGLSSSYLSVLFKKEVGVPISTYIQKVKIEEAKRILEYTDTPIIQICAMLDFTDQSYFTKIFKKITGVSPKHYRARSHLLNDDKQSE